MSDMTFRLFGQDVSASKALQKVGKEADSTGKNLSKHIGAGTMAAGAALGGLVAGGLSAVVGGFGDLIAAAQAAEAASRITAQVIKTTGGAAHVTSKNVDELATAISNKTGIDDDQIHASENMLLTFTNVRNEVGKGNDIFNQATQTVTDMSVALGQDAKDSAIQLGKALGDPLKGISALSRVGVTFTDQQKKQIKTLMDHNNILGAQKIILKELGHEFGGAAAASSDPMKKLSVIIGNVGKSLARDLLPFIEKAAAWVGNNLMPAIQNIIPVVENFMASLAGNTPVLAAIAAVIGGALTVAFAAWAIEIWSTTAALLANPIVWIVIAVVALIAAVGAAYFKFKEFRKIVDTVWAGIKVAIGTVVTWFVAYVWPLVKLYIGYWVLWFKVLWFSAQLIFNGIKTAINAVVTWFMATAWPIIRTVVGYIIGYYTLLWNTAKTIWTGVYTVISGAVTKITGVLQGVKSFFSTLWDGLAGGAKAAFNSVASLWNNTVGSLSFTIPTWVPGIGGDGFSMPKIPMMAMGGIVTSPTIAMIGEAGPEAVIPLSKMGGMGGGAPVVVNVYGWVGNEQQLTGQIIQGLQRAKARGMKLNLA